MIDSRVGDEKVELPVQAILRKTNRKAQLGPGHECSNNVLRITFAPQRTSEAPGEREAKVEEWAGRALHGRDHSPPPTPSENFHFCVLGDFFLYRFCLKKGF